MAQLGSVCGITENALIVWGKKKECSVASARSNCFFASGEHEVLNSTRPSFSGPVLGEAVTSAPHAAAASDRTTIVTSRTLRGCFMSVSSRRRRARGPAMDRMDLTAFARFLRGPPCRIVPVVLVHLTDGTFELFRYFLSPAAAFDRSAPGELRAVRSEGNTKRPFSDVPAHTRKALPARTSGWRFAAAPRYSTVMRSP